MGLAHRGRRSLLRRLAAYPALALLSGFSLPPSRPSGSAIAERPADALGPGLWDEFRRRFVTNDGRVVDDDGSTHSEGLGTALIASASVGDRAGFERVWAFARGLRRDDGLFSWRMQQGGRVIDANNASDGDLYIAWALARAAQRFEAPAFAREAREIARAVRGTCVRDTRLGPVMVPGRYGFDRGSRVVANPSYWVFPAFAALAAIDPHPAWKAMSTAASAWIARAQFGPRALTADWIEIESNAVAPWRERPARFGYEAIRVPLFLYWGRQLGHPQVQAFVRYAAAPAFPAWVALESDDASGERAPAGFESIARLVRALPSITRARLPFLNGSYYSSSLTLLAALANDDLVAEERQAQNAREERGASALRRPTVAERVGEVR